MSHSAASSHRSQKLNLSFPRLHLPPPVDLDDPSAALPDALPRLKASDPSAPIPLRLVNLPQSLSTFEVEQHLLFLGIDTSLTFSTSDKQAARPSSFEVPDHAAWFKLERDLSRSPLQNVYLQVDHELPPPTRQQDPHFPQVIIEVTSRPELSQLEVAHIAKAVRCGAFACNTRRAGGRAEMEEGGGGAAGGFRVPDEVCARRAVKMLDGLDLGGGRRLKARRDFTQRMKEIAHAGQAFLPPTLPSLNRNLSLSHRSFTTVSTNDSDISSTLVTATTSSSTSSAVPR